MPDTPTPGRAAVPDALAARFRHFATARTGAYAPLYAVLGAAIADDEDLLAIAAHARSGQSAPDLMLAAVHYQLARTPTARLAGFYPSLTDTPADPAGAPTVFRDFALEHRTVLKTLVGERTVQTNEVARCAYLRPALQVVAALAEGRTLALIEAGSSAGLNLLLDRYGYRYGPTRAGDPHSPVQLDCEVRGPAAPPLDLPDPGIGWRAGLDLDPLDPGDAQDRAWLEALVWPDHRARLARLHAALDVATAADRPRTYAGDAAETLPAAVADAPADAAVCLMHTAFLAHLPPPSRERFERLVPQLSETRPLYWVHAEPRTDPNEPRLQVSVAVAGRIEATWKLASYHPHGQWIAWNETDPLT